MNVAAEKTGPGVTWPIATASSSRRPATSPGPTRAARRAPTGRTGGARPERPGVERLPVRQQPGLHEVRPQERDQDVAAAEDEQPDLQERPEKRAATDRARPT